MQIPETVLLENEWVLRAAFDLNPTDICTACRHVCGLRNVTLNDGQLTAQVIDWHEAGFDFADAFHLALSCGLPTSSRTPKSTPAIACSDPNEAVDKIAYA